MNITLIGVDCAAQPNKTGLVRAIPDGEVLHVLNAKLGSKQEPPAKVLSEWIRNADRVLIALDAPLGWPIHLGAALIDHQAGNAVAPEPNKMFRRLTDDAIYERLGKRSFDVGADRIARATHAALRLLQELRRTLDIPIPLAWSTDWSDRVAAIEVYPAATRLGLKLPKVPKGGDSLEGLDTRLQVPATVSFSSEHVRDAVLCALAGQEFLFGRCAAPGIEQRPTALREGWIWAP